MKQINELSKKYFEKAVYSLKNWIQINSIYDESTKTKDMPFGKGVSDALRYIGELALEDGFDVDYCEGYCTEISFGNGPLIAIYAHADVVPVSGEWKYPPFSGEIEDDIMYGRGTSDDKGPAIAAYYALKILRDLDLIKGYKVSLVIGGNEESGSACLEHYFNELNKPYPVYGFTPDGEFPLIYGEKAIATYSVKLQKEFSEIESIKGGVVINSVIDEATCLLRNKIDESIIDKYCKNNGLTYAYLDNKLTFYGKAAHGSLPELGINAGLHLLIFLGELFNYEELVTTGKGYLSGDGKELDVYFESPLLHGTTYNVGLLSYENGVLEYFVNFRYPENVVIDEVFEKLDSYEIGDVTYHGTSTYLLEDPQSEMIQTLLKCYQEETGDYESKPMAIGGGTYAKESKNTVAFGSHFPGREDHIHEANEKIHLEDLYKSISIYAKAILRLGELARDK